MKLPKGQIFVLGNVLSEKMCKELIELIDKYAINEKKLKPHGNVQCTSFDLIDLKENEPKLYDKWNNIIHEAIFNIAKYLINRIPHPPIMNSDVGYELRRIHGPTREHVDGCGVADIEGPTMPKKMIRSLSIVIALNSDYKGGEFVFPEQDITVKLKAGQAIIFPPYWTHPHRTGELHGTYRYTINTWVCH